MSGDPDARPILFSGPMIRAILDGSKTQTRRAVKGAPADMVKLMRKTVAFDGYDEPTGEYGFCPHPRVISKHITCPYGQPGDLLWVRETWNVFAMSSDYEVSWPLKKIPATDPRLDEDSRVCVDYPVESLPGCDGGKGPWRPGIHMPRWASRLTLKITEVRSQRLQDISEEDAKAEGIRTMRGGCDAIYVGCEGPGNLVTPWPTAKEAFSDLWESINGDGTWESNPLVWAVSFERIAQEAA